MQTCKGQNANARLASTLDTRQAYKDEEEPSEDSYEEENLSDDDEFEHD